MKRSFSTSVLLLVCLSLYIVVGFTGVGVQAQSALAGLRPMAQANRVATQPDFGPQTRLSGHLPRWASEGAQVAGKVDLSSRMHVSIVLRRDAAVQAAFTQFLADQQDAGSPLYHQWLTPQQVGALFGPTVADVAAVSSWLGAQGLTVDAVSPSRAIVEVSGSVASVGNAFRTSFGYFDLNGTTRFSAVSEPSVPTALTPVIDSIHGLTEVPIQPTSLHSAPQKLPASGTAVGPAPQYTVTNSSGTSHFLTPNDFATIFDINSVYSAGNKGTSIGTKAQHVAIIGRSRVSASDIAEYAAAVGIASYSLNTIIPNTGVDPGLVCTFANAATCPTSGDQGEQTLDVDRVIGTAPGVQADLVVSGTVGSYDGIYIAASYNVNTLLDPVMTISYGACEYSAGSYGDTLWDTVFSAGAAEGISSFVSSGDAGANGCAPDGAATTTTHVASPNYICASSYATCVGGTEFNDTASPSPYWSSSNSTGLESAVSYIPEGAWNEPISGTSYQLEASGGGTSLYIAKPSWQTGTGVPTDGHRDTPDVAYPGAGHDGYYACMDFLLGEYTSQGVTSVDNCTNGYFFDLFGTSAAAPSMAAVTALLNTRLGVSQGNLNPLLYKLASSTAGSSVFHDTTIASSGVSSCVITTPSMCNNSTPGASGLSTTYTGGLQGYMLTTGYDEVTGLGSIDVAAFLSAAAALGPSLSLSAPAAISFTSGATTGNTTTTTLASVNSFIGTVNLSCSISAGSEVFAPSCTVGPGSSALTAGGSSTETITIGSITAQVQIGGPQQAGVSGWGWMGSVLLAALTLCLVRVRSRRGFGSLAALALVACSLVSGCSSSTGSGGSTGGGVTHGSSAGSYTVTVTATGITSGATVATTATTTFSLTIH